MSQDTWDIKYMSLAHHIAGWSKDRGRRVGVVIVGPDREIRATGFNGLPRGVKDDLEERHSRENELKYLWACHAELNAICNAARCGVSLNGCIMYVPWFPCIECAKAIIQSGIREVVAYSPDLLDPKWGKGFSLSQEMLVESGVVVRYIAKITDLAQGA